MSKRLLRLLVLLTASATATLGAGACRTARLAPAVDLAGYAGRDMEPKELQPWLPITWLRLPRGWGWAHEAQAGDVSPLEGWRLEEDPHHHDLPPAKLLFWHPEGTYSGAVFFIEGSERMDLERLRGHEVREGFARHVDAPSLAPARIDGRDAFLVRGRFQGWRSTFQRIGRNHARSRGDVALAVVHLPTLEITVVVAVVGAPESLSRDPAPAFDIFATCRFFDPPAPAR